MSEVQISPIVIAGGGTRLWPLSRANHPKQFFSQTGIH
jgi:mannose-1-phosphate guanylyltransferase